ncbi:molybdate ABC transporter substrate-binding protein [Limnoraphis robusta Tam1]|uniref:molybdate ABC transporter substrate-binding protein n=1 Tax=Limnoraphis robusta TaxID=1118279 RepID=UPI002B204DDF|nr:molybdate ABC transporter substrate-binding protein [Limnoraphis robusta]MEA5495701.1 molybdate ABC transporter substrate-binding protein [Limnoraphis robusta BA-68 BA1]MEA5540118.1 molybdate ABC transporter substrate-binding protein [Limnoraphis robusta Tam1]
MNRRRILNLACGFVLSLLLAVGCNQTTPQSTEPQQTSSPVSSAEQTELIISAAASLTDALNAIQPLYQQENPKVKLTYNFGPSGSLQQQIEQGAPVDVFISAAPKQINELQEKGLLLDETRKDLLKNEMVLIIPKGESTIQRFEDLTADTVTKIAVGEPESVPAGKYAQEVLTSLNIFETIQPKQVYAKDVRQLLSYVETGNVDAGITFSSNAKFSEKVEIVATAPPESHSPIIYPIAVVKNSKNPEAAKEFLSFLSSNTAKSLFERYGFGLAN